MTLHHIDAAPLSKDDVIAPVAPGISYLSALLPPLRERAFRPVNERVLQTAFPGLLGLPPGVDKPEDQGFILIPPPGVI